MVAHQIGYFLIYRNETRWHTGARPGFGRTGSVDQTPPIKVSAPVIVRRLLWWPSLDPDWNSMIHYGRRSRAIRDPDLQVKFVWVRVIVTVLSIQYQYQYQYYPGLEIMIVLFGSDQLVQMEPFHLDRHNIELSTLYRRGLHWVKGVREPQDTLQG